MSIRPFIVFETIEWNNDPICDKQLPIAARRPNGGILNAGKKQLKLDITNGGTESQANYQCHSATVHGN